MDETLSLSNSWEEGFQNIVDDSTDYCIVLDALYLVYDTPNILDLKDEIVVEIYFFSVLQKVPHDVFSPKIKEKDQDVTCFFLQDKRILVSPIYDKFLDEEEQIAASPFVDLRSCQLMCDNSELDFHEENHCVEVSHHESIGDIKHASLKINRIAFIILQHESVNHIKQPMRSKEFSF